jgi:hypothetical protein
VLAAWAATVGMKRDFDPRRLARRSSLPTQSRGFEFAEECSMELEFQENQLRRLEPTSIPLRDR